VKGVLNTRGRLSELLYRPMPKLAKASAKTDSIQIGANDGTRLSGDDSDDFNISGGKWEDEEERRFYEDIQDIKDFVPWSVLGLEQEADKSEPETEESLQTKADKEKEEVRKLEEELEKLADNGAGLAESADSASGEEAESDEDEYVDQIIKTSQNPLIHAYLVGRHL
jgi:regulator of nonsense transcripts 2